MLLTFYLEKPDPLQYNQDVHLDMVDERLRSWTPAFR